MARSDIYHLMTNRRYCAKVQKFKRIIDMDKIMDVLTNLYISIDLP